MGILRFDQGSPDTSRILNHSVKGAFAEIRDRAPFWATSLRCSHNEGPVVNRSSVGVAAAMGEIYRLISTRRTHELTIATMYVATKASTMRYVPTAPKTTSTTPAER
jgi:hypothetical protein